MITNKTKLLIFDMDGLLVDSERVYREGWNYGLHKCHVDIPDSVVLSWAGKSFHDTTAYLRRICKEEALCRRVREERENYIYRSLYDGNLTAKPYALDALRCAKEYGYQTGLATSSLKERSKAILDHLGLLPYLDIPVFADDVKRLKPYPDLYRTVLHLACCTAEQALAFEDSKTGYQAAEAAGIPVILIPDQSLSMYDNDIPEDAERDLSIVRKWITKKN